MKPYTMHSEKTKDCEASENLIKHLKNHHESDFSKRILTLHPQAWKKKTEELKNTVNNQI